jgi:chaperonin cofactor prefoldin
MPSSKSEDLKKQLDLLLARVKEQSAAARDVAKQLDELRRKIADMERSEEKK